MLTSDVEQGYPERRIDGSVAPEELIEWLDTMITIRTFEEALDPLSLAGKIPGGVHAAVGQEAVAVGAIRALREDDVVLSSHRPHHHAIARRVDLNAMMAELFGRASGTNSGRGGSMHIGDFDRHYFGGNGIVGASVGLGVGVALAARQRGTGQVAISFFGDGGVNTGRTWEAINLASIWALPLIVFCENNLYAVETETATVTAGGSILRRAEGFGLPCIAVDGQDVVAVHDAVDAACQRARDGHGPTFIEGETYRYLGHSTGQVVNYRTAEEVEQWRRLRDPIDRLREALLAAQYIDDHSYLELVRRARQRVEEATDYAERSIWPDPSTGARGVTEIDPRLAENR